MDENGSFEDRNGGRLDLGGCRWQQSNARYIMAVNAWFSVSSNKESICRERWNDERKEIWTFLSGYSGLGGVGGIGRSVSVLFPVITPCC
jgi:hypothetical protein